MFKSFISAEALVCATILLGGAAAPSRSLLLQISDTAFFSSRELGGDPRLVSLAVISAKQNRKSARASVPIPLNAKPSSDGASRVLEIAAAVDRRYNHLQTLQSDFAESYRGGGGGGTRTESGTLRLKRGEKMRWEYEYPQRKLFIADGKTAYFYVPGDRQVRRAPLKKIDDLRSPLRYLLGKTRLQKELNALSLAPDWKPLNPGDLALRGIPRTMADRVSEIVLEISPQAQIERIVIEEFDGAVTEFTFSRIVENVPLAESLFRFSVPAGAEVIDQQF